MKYDHYFKPKHIRVKRRQTVKPTSVAGSPPPTNNKKRKSSRRNKTNPFTINIEKEAANARDTDQTLSSRRESCNKWITALLAKKLKYPTEDQIECLVEDHVANDPQINAGSSRNKLTNIGHYQLTCRTASSPFDHVRNAPDSHPQSYGALAQDPELANALYYRALLLPPRDKWQLKFLNIQPLSPHLAAHGFPDLPPTSSQSASFTDSSPSKYSSNGVRGTPSTPRGTVASPSGDRTYTPSTSEEVLFGSTPFAPRQYSTRACKPKAGTFQPTDNYTQRRTSISTSPGDRYPQDASPLTIASSAPFDLDESDDEDFCKFFGYTGGANNVDNTDRIARSVVIDIPDSPIAKASRSPSKQLFVDANQPPAVIDIPDSPVSIGRTPARKVFYPYVDMLESVGEGSLFEKWEHSSRVEVHLYTLDKDGPYKVDFETHGNNFFRLHHYSFNLEKLGITEQHSVYKLNAIGNGWKEVEFDEYITFATGDIIVLKVWGAKTPFEIEELFE